MKQILGTDRPPVIEHKTVNEQVQEIINMIDKKTEMKPSEGGGGTITQKQLVTTLIIIVVIAVVIVVGVWLYKKYQKSPLTTSQNGN